LPPADDMLLAEEQPLPATVSPTAESPGYFIEPFRSESEIERLLAIPLQKRARFTTPTSRYEIGESSVAAARQIR
nr:hypothetical protein [Tanacetum cinerariifolium]